MSSQVEDIGIEQNEAALRGKQQKSRTTKSLLPFIIAKLVPLIFMACISSSFSFGEQEHSYNKMQYQYTTEVIPLIKKLSQSKKPSLEGLNISKFNFGKKINIKKKQLSQLQKSYNQINCVKLEPLFHQSNIFNKVMYFQTHYQFILPSCQNLFHQKWSISKQNLLDWYEDRFGVQWAFYTVSKGKGDRLLYYRPNVTNILEVVILSKIIGNKGELVLIDFQNGQCIDETLKEHRMPLNIKHLPLSQIYQQHFDIVIANQTIFSSAKIEIGRNTKLLIYSKDGLKLSKQQIFLYLTHFYNQFYRPHKFTSQSKQIFFLIHGMLKSFHVSKITLPQRSFEELIFDENLTRNGFYSVSLQSKLVRKTYKKDALPKNIMIQQFLENYYAFKTKYMNDLIDAINLLEYAQKQSMCINPDSSRVFSDFIVTIYGHKLYNVTIERVQQWQRQRQATEWVRMQVKPNQSIYYDMSNFNLLSILSIASLIGNNKMKIVCSQVQCQQISKQAKYNNIQNIELTNESTYKSAQNYQNIITDRSQLIKACISSPYLEHQNHSLLGYFAPEKNFSIELLKKIYTSHNVRQVTTPHSQSQCIGFEYLHFFWNSQNPNGFYQIKPSKYVIYTFWGGAPSQLSLRKRAILQEFTRLSVEIKIVSPKLFYYFELPNQPIHRAFPYLSSIHKSDYFRGYMMHNYGGGYADIKHLHFDWRPYFKELQQNETLYGISYMQGAEGGIACFDEQDGPSCKQIKSKYYEMMGNCHYILKKQTPLTKFWYTKVAGILDQKYQAVKRNPPKVLRQYIGGQFKLENGTKFISKYPIRWAEMAGQALTRAMYNYREHLRLNMPFVITQDYRRIQAYDSK